MEVVMIARELRPGDRGGKPSAPGIAFHRPRCTGYDARARRRAQREEIRCWHPSSFGVALSRVLAFRHWTSDVTASAVIGLVTAWIVTEAVVRREE